MTKAKAKPKAAPAKPEKERTMDERGHFQGSRKGKVHELFAKEGPEAAFVLGQRLKLKDNTLRSWFMVWRRAAKPAKATKVTKKVEKPETKPDKVEATVAAVH